MNGANSLDRARALAMPAIPAPTIKILRGGIIRGEKEDMAESVAESISKDSSKGKVSSY